LQKDHEHLLVGEVEIEHNFLDDEEIRDWREGICMFFRFETAAELLLLFWNKPELNNSCS